MFCFFTRETKHWSRLATEKGKKDPDYQRRILGKEGNRRSSFPGSSGSCGEVGPADVEGKPEILLPRATNEMEFYSKQMEM